MVFIGLENLLNHFCDIYHIREDKETPGYGLQSSPSFSYPKEPDISGQACHFGVKSANVTITQVSPANLMEAEIKLTLPVGTDVRRGDKIVDCETELEYTAQQPINVRNHHLFVYIKKTEEQKAL